MSSHDTPNGATGQHMASRLFFTAIFLSAWALTFSLAIWALSGSADVPSPSAAELDVDARDSSFVLESIELVERRAPARASTPR